jgi:5'(3')-deoxyribonucleotidase
MNKPIIAVDIDDTLVVHFQDLMTWYNNKYGTDLSLANNHPTSMDGWGTDDYEEAVRRVHRFFDTPQFKNAKPYAEAVRALRQLSDHYDLVVLTSRDTLIEQLTRDWLNEHFEDVFKEAHFTAAFSLEGKSRSKADVCIELGASYLIDDVLVATEEVAARGVKGILFGDYPWNQSIDLPSGVVRCTNWDKVLEYFDGQG